MGLSKSKPVAPVPGVLPNPYPGYVPTPMPMPVPTPMPMPVPTPMPMPVPTPMPMPMPAPMPMVPYAQPLNLAPQEIENLRQLFFYSAGPDQRLQFHEFVALYARMHPQTIGPNFNQLAANAFFAMDTNRTGRVNFYEFLGAYSRLRQQARMF